MDLHIDPEELNACVQCGLCLPSCPTYRVTGDEALSPRGRIALMRRVQDDDAPLDDQMVNAFATCVQCRGCEPACPSGVPYGNLIEATRSTLATEHQATPTWLRLALEPLSRPQLLRFGARAAALADKVGLDPARFGLPPAPTDQTELTATGDDVYLFTGCVMDAFQRDVHAATLRVVTQAGAGVTPTGDAAPCCGALHHHAGLSDRARALARQVIDALDDNRPILVNSAGCGAALKEYGELLGTDEAHAFSARVLDVTEWLVDRIDQLPAATPLPGRVAIQDPCHLRHVQRSHEATRAVLAPFVSELVELDDDGLCCGAGGAYALLQPDLAGQIRDRKVAAIDRQAPDWVSSANPGCALHLNAAGVPAIHPLLLIDAAVNGTPLPDGVPLADGTQLSGGTLS